jgi:hypothetical protein
MIGVKPGARVFGMRVELLLAVIVADQVIVGLNAGPGAIITSVIDSIHEDGSDHYRGEGLDIRTQDPGAPPAWKMSDAQRAAVRAEMQARLGPDYVVIDEGGDAANSTAPHIHVSFRPRKPYSST